jgi:hypothetical protein
MRIAQQCGWWWPFANAVIVTERPSLLQRDVAHRLHSGDGAALAYSDGWSIHAWHGFRVPAWVIEEKHKLNPKVIQEERNAELRRVMFEIYTPERYISETGAVLLSEDTNLGYPRKLYEVALGAGRARVVHLVNHSLEPDGTRREFWLGMPDDVTSPHEAVARSFGFHPEHYKEACAS